MMVMVGLVEPVTQSDALTGGYKEDEVAEGSGVAVGLVTYMQEETFLVAEGSTVLTVRVEV